MLNNALRLINRILRVPRNQFLLIGALVLAGVVAEGLLVINFIQLSQNIQQNFAPTSNLLPKIAGLRADLLRLENETLGALLSDRPDFTVADTVRSSADDRLKALQKDTIGQPQYTPTFESAQKLLTNYDILITKFRNTPPGQRASISALTVFQFQEQFRETEKVIDDLYRREETRFFDASNGALNAVNTAQAISFVVATIIIAFGATLIIVIRGTVQAEITRSAERLQVAAEVGRAASSLLSLDELFSTSLNLICSRFSYFSASIYLLDENGEYAILHAGTTEINKYMKEKEYQVLVGSNSIVGFVTANNTYRLISASSRGPAYFRNEMSPSTRSELTVPLRQSGQVVGALDVQSLDPEGFSDEDISIIQTLADQIAVAIGNAAQFTREQSRAQQLEMLVESSNELNSPQINLEATLTVIARRLMHLLKCDDGAVWLPVSRDQLEMKAQINTPQNMGRRLKVGEGMAGQVFANGQSLKVDDYPTWSGRSIVFNDAPFHAALAVPMKWQGKVVGVLVATKTKANELFKDDDVRLTELFASQAASAIENTNLLAETQGRMGELFILNQLGQAIAAQTDLQALYEIVRQEVSRATRTDNVYVALYDSVTNIFEIPYMYGDGKVTSIPPMQLGQGLTSVIIQTRQPLLINNDEEAAQKGAMIGGGTGAAQSYLGVPMIAGNDVIGVLAVQDLHTPNRFTEADTRFLQTVGTQIGVAVQNARLYQQLQRRAEQLFAAAEVSRVSISITHPDELIVKAVELIRERFDLYYAAIFLVDAAGKQAVLKYATGEAGQELMQRKHHLEVGGQSMVGGTIYLKQARIALDVGQVAMRFANPLLPDTHSEMALPLRVGDNVFGALDVQSTQLNAFSGSDITVLQTMADQIAIAIQNAGSLSETQRRLEEIATLNHISQVAAAQTEMRTLLDAVREEITRLTQTDNVYFALYDAAAQTFEIPYMYEEGEVHTVPPNPLGRGLTSVILQTRKPLLLHSQEEAMKLGAMVGGGSGMAQSYLGVPLLAGDTAIGVLAIQDLERPERFTEANLHFMETVASQIAIALQNTRLFEQTKKRANELTAINRITEAARTALDVPTMLSSVTREITTIFSAWRSEVALMNPAGDALILTAEYASNQSEASLIGTRIPIADNPSTQQVLETRDILVVPDAQFNPLTAPMHTIFREHNVQSLMLVPLIVRGDVIGTLGIDSTEPEHEFKPEEIALARTLATQVANAIENVRLYQQVQRRAEQLLAAADVSRVSTSYTNPDELIVQAVELIRERFTLYYAALFLMDDTRTWAVLKHATGTAGQELLQRKHRLEIGGRSMVGSAISMQQARIALDVGAEAVRFANPLLPETHSEMALPLRAGNTVLGALDVQSTEYNAFSEADVTVLQTMADQIAIAIQNAQLFSESQRRAQLERQINQATNRIRRAVDADSIMAAVLAEMNQILGTKRAVAILGPEQEILNEPGPAPDNGHNGNSS